jgi:hypothetical protein
MGHRLFTYEGRLKPGMAWRNPSGRVWLPLKGFESSSLDGHKPGQDDWAWTGPFLGRQDPVGSSCDFQFHPGPGEHEQLHESVQRSLLAAWQTAGKLWIVPYMASEGETLLDGPSRVMIYLLGWTTKCVVSLLDGSAYPTSINHNSFPMEVMRMMLVGCDEIDSGPTGRATPVVFVG